MLSTTFRAFQYRDFRLLWLGACTSSVGTWMQKLAQSWLVLEMSDSAFMLGLDAFLGEIPIFLLSMIGGVAADRMDRRRLLLASQFLQMACAFALAFLVVTDLVRVWHILCLSFLVGVAQAFGGPAYQAIIPALVKPDHLPNAIALNSIQFNLARILGPALGGLALTQLGAAWCFGLNGLSYVAVIISLVALRTSLHPGASSVPFTESFKEGLVFIRQRQAMVSLIVLAFCMTVLAIPVVVFLPVFAKDVFQKGPSTYTLLLAISGIGSVLGALAVAALGHLSRKGLASLILLLVLGSSITLFSLSTSLLLSCVALFIASAALIAVFALVTSLVQLITVDEMRGRVMSIYNVAFRGGMPIGSLAAGSLAPVFSAPLVLAVYGGVLVLLAGYFLAARREVAEL